MNIEQLTGRCCRLKQELLIEYRAPSRNSGRIARLTAELVATERDIAAAILDRQRESHGDFRHAA
jgi:hypothetical protein